MRGRERSRFTGGVPGAEAMEERGGERAGVLVRELVVQAQRVGVDVDHPAADDEPRAEQLLGVVPGVQVDRTERHGPRSARSPSSPAVPACAFTP